MQRAFKGDEEDEDNNKLMNLLLDSYKNEKKATRVMDKHMDLIETMNKSNSIKECEKHQKKTLKQIRGLLLQIVMKRKLRQEMSKGSGATYTLSTLSKPPNLSEVRT